MPLPYVDPTDKVSPITSIEISFLSRASPDPSTALERYNRLSTLDEAREYTASIERLYEEEREWMAGTDDEHHEFYNEVDDLELVIYDFDAECKRLSRPRPP
ncbi:hypothetical protein H0H92_002950 [Tricholoma furcatifolium]|nr:hypothetical protein H0H92_002950 [Tricholoma furcatifolium]